MPVASILQNRNFAGLLLANTVLGAAFPVQLILGGLAGLMLAPSPALATVPSSFQTLAALFAAAPFSLLMGRFGRRAGFALGALITLVGAGAAIQAVYAQNFALLIVAHFLMGAGWSSFQYFRFAAGEVVEATMRPVAISLMLSSLLIAAIVGPQVFIAAKDMLAPIPFVGAYAAVGVIAVLGLVPLAIVRMPRPARVRTDQGGKRLTGLAALRRPAIARAVAIAAVSQGIMVFLMIPTPIAMVECGFSDATASDVVRWHIVAMFAPSFFTGFLIQRFGAHRVAMVGLALIVAAAAGAALGLSAHHFYGSLIVLGVGWNFGFIGATTMLDAAVSEEEKAAVQGANDTVIALVSTVCAFAAGWVLSSLGWAALAMMSGGIVVLALALLGRRTVRVAA
ncbi:MFS transporter [Tateyamaria sp. ANG-S1]|uniref:MFS transporter n=1 Tax=Tateyamaria sp. ANG-S1 TaxID=1577905 RepID=UPI00057DEE09|nr:MFS transporter [Tateyamaria sp. ANG-S1]KIC50489.1 MFS transporter [Tateyamaria sp. ANG-S1]